MKQAVFEGVADALSVRFHTLVRVFGSLASTSRQPGAPAASRTLGFTGCASPFPSL